MLQRSLNVFINDNAFLKKKKNRLINIYPQQTYNTTPSSRPSPYCSTSAFASPSQLGRVEGKEGDSGAAALTGDKQETHAWLDRLRLWWLLASFFLQKAQPAQPTRLPACLPADVLLLAPEETLVWRMTHYYPLISVSACWASNWNILNRCKNTCEPGRASCAALCFIYPWCEP